MAQVLLVRIWQCVPVGKENQDGKRVPWGSSERVDISRGSVGTGCSLCLRHAAAMCATSQHLPHHRGSDLPAGAAAENSLPQGGLLTHPSPCCLCGWDLTGGGTGIDFCASLCNFSCSQCLQGAGTGAKTVVLMPVWPLGMHCDRSTLASGSSQAPTGGFFFPCEAHIDSCRRQK